MRRHPQQARGKRRVDQILDSADLVIGRVGLEGATTNAIADAARTSIGSVYQFFHNKSAIITALCERHAASLTALLAQDMPGTDSCEVQVGALLDVITEYYAANPGFRAFLYGEYASSEASMIHETLIMPLVSQIALRASESGLVHQKLLVAEAALFALSRLLYLAVQSHEEGKARLLPQEQKVLLVELCCRSGTQGV